MGFFFEHRDSLGHDEHRLADVGVPAPLHPYRGLGDVIREAAHLVDDGPFVWCQLPRVLGVLPENLADRFLQGQTAIHHLELAGPLSRRDIFRKGKSRGGREGWGPAGQMAGGSIFYIFIFLFTRWKSNEAKGTPNVSIIKHRNESRRYTSNLKTKSFNFKYHIRPDLMRDRKRRSKMKNGVFRCGFFDQKKSHLILRKAIYFFLIEKSRSKNAVFRFRSAFSISHKIGPNTGKYKILKFEI